MGAINVCSNTALGPDRIESILYKKHIPLALIKILMNVFNKIWEGGKLAKSWHHAIMIPVPINRARTRIHNNQLNWYLEKYGKLCTEQSGFRSGRSVIDSTIKLHNDIIKAWIIFFCMYSFYGHSQGFRRCQTQHI